MSRLHRTTAALAAASVALLAAALPAHAAGYQFWGYYQLVDGEWAFAVEGAGTTVPDDGTVQGLRFAVSSGDEIRAPRDVLEFDEVCADVPAEDGSKRIALVIDPGRDVDAPEGQTPPAPGAQCVLAEPDATTLDLVRQVVPDVRTDENTMVCGLAGFPESGCSEEIAEPSPEQLAADEPIQIPVIPIGQPVLAPPTDQPTQEPTTGATDEPTEEDTAAPTSEAPTDDATTEDTAAPTGETTAGPTATATEDSTDEAEETTEAPPSETPDEADPDEDSSVGIPPWAWAVGILALLGILAFAATSARNRRLDAAQREPYDDRAGDGPDDLFRDGPGDAPPGSGDGR
ncbi:SCO2322 family protein [Ornithinimicrobium murale]|uniref:SCO2322 family protein n=1 Tax=Ornithinimicrobium murale TaxID=1050153 RepID=UPI000E0CC0AD|nr:SCO2322 family protein [Ornithinimicrobium murale]